ncbi:MAG: response regulator [Anaerolineae bacterium]|nr:response regulator [Anaerolineae bacterium]
MIQGALLMEQAAQPSSVPAKQVLIVDDEITITWLLRETLEQLSNCRIWTAAGGEDALTLCETTSFDLIITDYKMPGMDGLTLAGAIRRLQPDAVIVLLTGGSSEDICQRASALAIRKILNKPLRLSMIRQTISKIFTEMDQREV